MIIQGVKLTGVQVVDGSISTQNLAIWIDANNTSSYPGTGTTITDLSGNGRTQTLVGASQYTVLSGIKCFDCAYGIGAASIGPTLPTTGFTYIAWARMISSSANYRTLFRCSPNDHPLLIQIGTDNLGMWDNTTNIFYPCGFSVNSLANTWVQWAVTGDGSGQIFYINGQNVGSVTAQTSAGNNHNITGNVASGLGSSQPFGYIANMFLYTRKLPLEQIQQNYGALKSVFGV